MQKRHVVTGLAALLLVPALAIAQKTTFDYSKSANFAAYKTYAMKDGTKVGQQMIDDRIAAAIEAQMAAKGFTKADANPDVVVVYHVAFDKQKDISTFSSGYGGGYGPYGYRYGGGWGGGTTSTQVRDILIGTLVIDMADVKANEVVWRGMGVKEVDTTAKPDKRDKSINNAVEKIFKNYPPKAK
jgi:osmotically-inducible protein OsmY